MSTQITTGKVRFSYCNLFTPRAVQEGATPKYSVTLLIPKSDKATMQKIKAAMDEAKKRPRHNGCRLPQYTAKEMREMSGPTYTLNLKKRITYAEFKALPEGLQKSYVQNIIDRYHVGPSALAELMGANAGAVGVYLSKRGFSFKRGFQPTKDDLERFREDYGISTNTPTKKNNFGELLVLLLRSLQCGELCKANQGLRPRRTTPAGLRSSRGSRARALCY